MQIQSNNTGKKLLLISRSALVKNTADGQPSHSLVGIEFFPGVFNCLGKIAAQADYEIYMLRSTDEQNSNDITSQSLNDLDEFILRAFRNENIQMHIVDASELFSNDIKPSGYDLLNSYLIADTSMAGSMAAGLGCEAILLRENACKEIFDATNPSVECAKDWWQLYPILQMPNRRVTHERNSKETKISVQLDLDGTGKASIKTGLGFFDHMLEQLARHSSIDINLRCDGDLHIDEHHTIEDTAIALGEAFSLALVDKRGMERYGFCLPMDDALARVALDFGGRSWLVWKTKFKRKQVGDVPTEMFEHFFKSFTDAARCNVNINCKGKNDHHKIEAIFKAFAKAVKMAIKRDNNNRELPSTKGIL